MHWRRSSFLMTLAFGLLAAGWLLQYECAPQATVLNAASAADLCISTQVRGAAKQILVSEFGSLGYRPLPAPRAIICSGVRSSGPHCSTQSSSCSRSGTLFTTTFTNSGGRPGRRHLCFEITHVFGFVLPNLAVYRIILLIMSSGGALHRALELQTCVAKGLATLFRAESLRDNHFSLNARAIWSCMGLIK